MPRKKQTTTFEGYSTTFVTLNGGLLGAHSAISVMETTTNFSTFLEFYGVI